MKVQAGLLTATEGAKQLGVSRKTYYELETKALSGMMQAIHPGRTGRPKTASRSRETIYGERNQDVKTKSLR